MSRKLIGRPGFPYPDNVALASLLESVVRAQGGIPATIGILDGVARVGLDPEELIRLASSAGQANTLKLSRRDLGYVCGTRLTNKSFNGGTTISGTMLLAHLAGIKIFGTGGLGGVHRGAESSMDISADLTELGRTPVTVVSSGCKSFLDIPRTIEYLETEGVGVGTFADGRAGNVDFPAFWSRDSGVKSPVTIADEIEAAAVIRAYSLCLTNTSNINQMHNTHSKSLLVSFLPTLSRQSLPYPRKKWTLSSRRLCDRPMPQTSQAKTTRPLCWPRSRSLPRASRSLPTGRSSNPTSSGPPL